MSKQKLFDDESEEEVSLKTENEYAKKYDKWREKEELHKLEQKYGSKPLNSDGSGSSDSEDESDEPPEISEETEAQFLKTLSLLKTKDPRIYDPTFKCFLGNEKKEPEKETKVKTLTFADSDDEDGDDDGNIFTIEKKAEIVEDSQKDRKQIGSKGSKIKEYLTGQAEHIDKEVEEDLAPLKALWSDPKLNEGEAFLRDYILNHRYLEEGDTGDAEGKLRDDEDLQADEERVEEQGKFERAYNFRFEEPDQEYLKRFPRTMDYIRPKDERRSRKRVELRTRKEEEKKKKMEEIGRLKALKLKEIQEKLARIKEVSGNEELAFQEGDLDSEFDPSEHDKRMKEIFDEEYYGDADNQKPVFPDLDDELEIENWDKYQPENGDDGEVIGDDEPHCEDDDFNMDADYDPKQARNNLLDAVKDTLQGKKRRNRKKKSKLAQILEVEKPKFIPATSNKSYNDYMEEYYKMDCEDIIGDLPTRFRYRQAPANDYGLTVEEILLADDKELTQWVPLKKILKYRPDNVEKGDAKTYALKAADIKLKRKILPSLFKDLPEDPDIVVPIEETTKKKNKKKKKKKVKESTGSTDVGNEANETVISIEQEDSVNQNNSLLESVENEQTTDSEKPKKKKHKNKNKAVDIEQETNLSPNKNVQDLTQESNINTEKSKKKKRKNKIKETSLQEEHATQENNSKEKQYKKGRNNKSEEFIVDEVVNAEPSHEETLVQGNKKNKSKRKSKDNVHNNDNTTAKKAEINSDSTKNVKRKANFTETGHNNKKRKGNDGKQNGGFRNKKAGPINPLVNLSDERLKAFGLNPKKYKNFLHFKKY